MQVCLAAEECGHLHFDVRQDIWWKDEGFVCESYPPEHVRFRRTFLKVRHVYLRLLAHFGCRVDWLSGRDSTEPQLAWSLT